MKQQKQTQAQRMKAKAASLKASVKEILLWDEFEYNNFQFECGIEYLSTSNNVMGFDNKLIPDEDRQHWITQLSFSKIFWQWWCNQWSIRDSIFIGNLTGSFSLSAALELYKELHDPEMLSHNVRPNKVILTESYEQMIKRLIKAEQEQ